MKKEKRVRVSKKQIFILFSIVVVLSIVTSYMFTFIYKNINQVVFAKDNTKVVRQIVEVERVIEEEVIVTKEPFNLVPIGEYELTAYCPCEICCEEFAGPPLNKTTSIGTGAYEGNTIAVDPNKIPYGTTVYIEDIGVRIASDCGGAIKGNRIDVYYEEHEDAWYSGLGHTPKQVYIIEENDNKE